MSEHSANLLMVEDEPITPSQLTSHLEKEGYAVTGSATADGVLERITDGDVDLCLIDISLPGKDRLTLTREIRARSDVGITLMTESLISKRC